MTRRALLVFALALILTVSQLAVIVLGSWEAGWRSAAVGAGVGGAVGLLAGLGVAWLRIPERLGLDAPPQEPEAANGRDG